MKLEEVAGDHKGNRLMTAEIVFLADHRQAARPAPLAAAGAGNAAAAAALLGVAGLGRSLREATHG